MTMVQVSREWKILQDTYVSYVLLFCRSSQSSSYIRWKQVSSPGTMWGTSFSVLNWWWKWLVSVPSGEFSVRLCATAGLWEHVWPIQAEGLAEPVWKIKQQFSKNFLVESILVWYCDVCVVFMLCCVVLYCVASLVYVVRLKSIFFLVVSWKKSTYTISPLAFQFFLATSFLKLRVHMWWHSSARCLRTQRMSRAPPATGLTRCTNFNAKQRVWLGSVMNIKTTSWDQQQFVFSV